jgi:hypothetical protein
VKNMLISFVGIFVVAGVFELFAPEAPRSLVLATALVFPLFFHLKPQSTSTQPQT